MNQHQQPDLTIVLLGDSGVGKSASGNTILGRKAFVSKQAARPVTKEISTQTGNVCGKRISVVDTPGILETRNTEKEIKIFCQNLLRSSRGPCLFLVVVRVGRFRKEEEKAVKAALGALRGMRNSYLLFTGGDMLEDKSVEDFIFEDGDEGKLPDVVRMFAGAYHLFNNNDDDEEQVRHLLLKSGHLRTRQQPASPAPWRERRRSKEQPPDMRLVLVGRTGAGKSSSGNNILGRDAFSVGRSSVTRQCCKQTGEVSGRQVTIVDTPGLFDTSLPGFVVQREISKCINMSAPGPHAILLVIKMGPFTETQRFAIRQVEEIFGEDAWKYTIVLFTRDDQTGADMERQLQEAGPELQRILTKAGHRYHVLNNGRTDDRGQVLDLLEKVQQMVDANGGQYYSNKTYLEVEELLQEREAKLREFYKKKMQEKMKSVESKYRKKLSEAQQDRQKVEERLQSELQEVKRYYHALESGVRHVVEQAVPTDSMEDILKFHEDLKLDFSGFIGCLLM